ncbi:sensor histidine kinase [Amycolatopsis antarctica]|uniref:histidine kinase n=1 Tax=Amycolatopsis antarctica TaxID=1854586 RepID=A0A263D789_9PSEU|nr:histidine kinase [Amycolatopsis antarctica]OZM73275.1 sensor histidine kinase [Amycolatopsis antarctica]
MVTPPPNERRARIGHPVRFLASAGPWHSFAYVITGAGIGSLLLLAPAAAMLGEYSQSPATATAVLAILILFLVARPLASIERTRLTLTTRNRSVNYARKDEKKVSYCEYVRRGRAFRELAYAVVFTSLFTFLNLGLLGVTFFCIALTILPAVVVFVAPDTVMLGSIGTVDHVGDSLPFAAAGVVGAITCIYLASLSAAGQAAFATFVLLPKSTPQNKVQELTLSRARLVSTFDAERQKIERDLHDGAQQRLLAVSLTLKLAGLELQEHQSASARLVGKAQREAQQALTELRELVRGIHPRVLTERGVEAAIEDLATRCPVPVEVDVLLSTPLTPSVERAVYYLVSEALTNVVKHGSATLTQVSAAMYGERLHVTVSDDGVGGADSAKGSGLNGLADRIAVLDGRLTLTSPPGGPTILTAEIPVGQAAERD